MADRPILFSAPMVRAVLDGRKTQTRRPLSGVPEMPTPDCHPRHSPRHEAPYLDAYCSGRKTGANPRGMSNDWCWWQIDDRPGKTFRVPHAPGDRLWVRETWAHYQTVNYVVRHDGRAFSEVSDGFAGYRADGFDTIAEFKNHVRLTSERDFEAVEVNGDCWRPSIHMPRWASRLTLIVTDVRVQRLCDISEEDAIAEGIEGAEFFGCPCWKIYGDGDDTTAPDDPIASFASLWDACYGPGAWEANSWVVATTFTAHPCNIDRMEA